MSLLHSSTVTIVTTIHGAVDEDGVVTTTTSRLDVPGCNVQPVDGSEVASPDMETVTIRWRVFAPAGTQLHVGDRVEWLGESYRVDEEPLHRMDEFALLPHVEWFMRRWS